MGLGQIGELLVAVAEALPGPAPLPEGEVGLDQLPTGAEGIAKGVEESHHPAHRVRVEHHVHPDQQDAGESRHDEAGPRRSRDEEKQRRQRDEYDRVAEIRLQQEQARREDRDSRGLERASGRELAAILLSREPVGDRDQGHALRQLAGLETKSDAGQLEPALRSVHLGADRERHDQEQNREPPGGQREPPNHDRRRPVADCPEEQPGEESSHMIEKERWQRRLEGEGGGRAVAHHHPDQDQNQARE